MLVMFPHVLSVDLLFCGWGFCRRYFEEELAVLLIVHCDKFCSCGVLLFCLPETLGKISEEIVAIHDIAIQSTRKVLDEKMERRFMKTWTQNAERVAGMYATI